METMIITNKETKEKLNVFWLGNPFTGIANFPEEIVHGPDCEMLVEVENPETGVFEKPDRCTCKPILKECITAFKHDKLWRKAIKDITLPATTDVEDDARFDELVASYVRPLLGDETPLEPVPETPVLTEIMTAPLVIELTKVDEVVDIAVELKDQDGKQFISDEIPSLSSVYGKIKIDIVDGKFKATMLGKGVDIIRVRVGEITKDIVVKIRDIKPYPNVFTDVNNVKWLKLDLDEYNAYVQAKVIVHPELAALVEEREYWWNELFVNTAAWSDHAVRSISDPTETAEMDAYREAVASTLNWCDSEIALLNTNTPPVAKGRTFMTRQKPTIPARPEAADKYKP